MAVSLPNFRECFANLIATPSVSSVDARLDQSNKAVIDLLAEWLAQLGFVLEMMPVSDNPDKFNLVACAGHGAGGLVLSGHTDTVPCNESAWDSDPFRLTEQDNRLYGLGTSDMKCFFPIVIEMLQQLDLAALKQPLYILATCDEESTMAGAKALVEHHQQLGRHAWIGEPTGLKPVNMHKGIVMEMIRLTGRSGHSSDPSLGVSALEGMNAVINKLLQWRAQIQAEFNNPAFKVPVPTLNLGYIRGGDNPNRICADCELSVDLRLLPGMEIERMRAAIRTAAMQAVDGSGLTVEFDAIVPGLSCLATAADAEIVTVAEKLSGHQAGAVAFGTEGPYFNQMGMDTVVLGPGDIDQAHQANEYLSMDRIDPMITLLTRAVEHFCLMEAQHAD